MTSRKVFLMATLMVASLCRAEEIKVTSPSGNLEVVVSDEGGKPTYQVSLDGKQMVTKSYLGLNTSIGDLTSGLKIVANQTEAVEKHYDMRTIKTSHIDYKANKLVLTLQNEQKLQMTITFMVSDNDVAFRYGIAKAPRNMQRTLIYGEATSFNFPDGTTTFITPQIGPKTGWANTKPSYEEGYSVDGQLNEKSHYGIAFPDKGENGGFGSEFVAVSLPAETPWRTITLGATLKPIVETTISYDVVDPLYEPSEPYKEGRYTWSWLIWQDNATVYKDQVQFIDLASAMGYEYCLVDALWDTQIGRDKMVELSRYAQSKGVSLMLWYNSNGYWNDAPQGPRNCLNSSLARNREFKWLQEIGVKGIKVDFFGGDKQETLQLYEDIMVDANRYGIQVIFHGCTLPRGWERMFPNYVASEAVLASENVFFGEGQTSIQCVAMCPNNLQELPQFELDFLKTIPTTWDETRFLDGYPGKYVVLARRHGADWYIAGLNAQKEPLKLTLQLPMFAGKTITLYVDNQKGEPTQTTLKVDKKGQAKIVIQPNGGAIMCNTL